MKPVIIAMLLTGLCFGQTLRELEAKAQKYGIDNADKFFKHDPDYTHYRGIEKASHEKSRYIRANIDKYKEFINIEIINILEETASSKKKITYEAFVRKHRGEPNMTDDRARNFRETGYYIDEYEEYVNGK